MMSTQNRRQKVFNRGLCFSATRLWVCCWVLDTLKLTKTQLICGVLCFNLGRLGDFFGEAKPPKPRRNGTVSTNFCWSRENVRRGSSWKTFVSVTTVQCWRRLVTGRQVTVFLLRASCRCRRSRITTVYRECCTPSGVCCHHSFPHSTVYELERHLQPHRRWSIKFHCWKVQDHPFTFCWPINAVSIILSGSPTCAWSVCSSVRPSGNEKHHEKDRVIMSLQKSKSLYPANKRQCTATGEDQPTRSSTSNNYFSKSQLFILGNVLFIYWSK